MSETYDNILLWSHYCASHTGFVLAIELDEKNNHIQKVEYKNTLPDFDLNWYFSVKDVDTPNSETVGYLLKDFAIKAKKWEYEEEWRVCRRTRGYFRFQPNQVKALYYGLNCQADIEKIIAMTLSYMDDDFPIYKMTLSTNPLKMSYEDYELPKS